MFVRTAITWWLQLNFSIKWQARESIHYGGLTDRLMLFHKPISPRKYNYPELVLTTVRFIEAATSFIYKWESFLTKTGEYDAQSSIPSSPTIPVPQVNKQPFESHATTWESLDAMELILKSKSCLLGIGRIASKIYVPNPKIPNFLSSFPQLKIAPSFETKWTTFPEQVINEMHIDLR